MGTLWQDIRYGVRMLRKDPGFTIMALVTLALGMGANTAIFSLMYTLLLRSLPVPHPEELRFLCQRTPEGQKQGFSYAACRMMSEQSRSFTAIGMVGVPGPFLASTPGGNLETLRREYAGAGYFAALGLRPAAGRVFTYEEDTAASTSVVISYRYWKRKFNLSPEAVGSTLYAGVGKPFTIIGVMPPEYSGITPEYAIDIWLQESDGRTGLVNEHSAQGWYQPLARLKPHVSQKQAMAELDTIFQRYLQEYAASFPEAQRSDLSGRHVLLTPGGGGDSGLGRQLSRPLTVLMILVALVLLLACANIGNMLLARTASRSREIAIRIAVGAGRGHLVRQLLTESLVLAMMGGAFGLALASWGARVLVTFAPGYVLNINVSPDLRVLAFTAVVSLGAGLLFGSLPALHAARSDVAPVLKGSNTVLRIGRYHLSKLLVVSQVALAIVLLAGAGLFIGTLAKLTTQDTGFARRNVALAEVVTPLGYRPEADPAIWRLMDKLRQMPGVLGTCAGTVPSDTPLYTVEVEGYRPPAEEKPQSQFREVSDGFFETLRTPLREGRLLERRDCGRSPNKVAVVNESFARRFFGGESPLGRRINAAFASHKVGPLEIVGVVADARYTNLDICPTARG